MRKEVIIGTLILLTLFAAGYFFAVSNPKTYHDAERGINFSVPTGWSVSEEGSKHTLFLRSPDFTTKDTRSMNLKAGEEVNIVETGAEFGININTVNEKIAEPEAYIAFRLPDLKNCSNCQDVKEITLGGQRAVFYRVVSNGWENVEIDAVYRNREVTVAFLTSSSTPETERILSNFISSFKFD